VEHLRQMLEYGLDHRRSKTRIESVSMKKMSVSTTLLDFDVNAGIKMVGGDEDIYRELLADFVENLPSKIKLFERFFLEKDFESLARSAHNIKGVASNLGILQLNEHADKLEKSVSEGYTGDSLEIILREIKEISQNFITDASNFLAKPRTEM